MAGYEVPLQLVAPLGGCGKLYTEEAHERGWAREQMDGVRGRESGLTPGVCCAGDAEQAHRSPSSLPTLGPHPQRDAVRGAGPRLC